MLETENIKYKYLLIATQGLVLLLVLVTFLKVLNRTRGGEGEEGGHFVSVETKPAIKIPKQKQILKAEIGGYEGISAQFCWLARRSGNLLQNLKSPR